MKNIIISNPKDLEEKIKKISKQGKDKIHVIADFDRTLTKGIIKGRKSATLISHIRDGGYLTPDYPKKAHALFDKYHPIEIDPDISLDKKKKLMTEWWKAHFSLLKDSGMNLNVIKDIVQKKDPYFRQGSLEFLDYLNKKQLPIVIMSAAPGDMIKAYLEKNNQMKNNVHIIANFFEFDENGIATSRRDPPIHTFNKSEISIKELPIYKELLKRKNVLLLGDSLGDIGMVEGFPYENLIKIGFLNENVNENIEDYKKAYDVVITKDSNMNYVNGLLKKLIN